MLSVAVTTSAAKTSDHVQYIPLLLWQASCNSHPRTRWVRARQSESTGRAGGRCLCSKWVDLEYLASDMTEEEILADFPALTHEDLKACIAFAADRERKLMTVPAA